MTICIPLPQKATTHIDGIIFTSIVRLVKCMLYTEADPGFLEGVLIYSYALSMHKILMPRPLRAKPRPFQLFSRLTTNPTSSINVFKRIFFCILRRAIAAVSRKAGSIYPIISILLSARCSPKGGGVPVHPWIPPSGSTTGVLIYC